jgi:hypothetical protein
VTDPTQFVTYVERSKGREGVWRLVVPVRPSYASGAKKRTRTVRGSYHQAAAAVADFLDEVRAEIGTDALVRRKRTVAHRHWWPRPACRSHRRRPASEIPRPERTPAEPRVFNFAMLEAAGGAESMNALARMLDVDRQRIYRWRRDGLTATEADHMAVCLGLHPGDIWPQWWDLAEPS